MTGDEATGEAPPVAATPCHGLDSSPDERAFRDEIRAFLATGADPLVRAGRLATRVSPDHHAKKELCFRS